MSADIAASWDGISADWDNWCPPLRPSPEDVQTVHMALSKWAQEARKPSVDALLLGVTREIASSKWPIPVKLLAVDASPMMVQRWGFKSGSADAVVGDWFNLGAPASRDAVFGDGSFVFYGGPRSEALRLSILSTLRPGGLYAGRHFVLPASRETLQDLFRSTEQGLVPNFGTFKFRLAMALQESEEDGVMLDDVWQSVQACGVDFAKAGFPGVAVATIDHYRGKTGRLYFPTVANLVAAFRAKFSSVEVFVPGYPFGGCCPTLIATA